MDALTTTDSVTALHRAYMDAVRAHCERKAEQDEPSQESIVRAHRRAVAIERIRSSLATLTIDIR